MKTLNILSHFKKVLALMTMTVSLQAAPIPATSQDIGWEQLTYETSENTALTYGDSSQMPMKITLDHAVDYPVSVSFATHNGTAIGDSDYRTSSGTVTIPAGQTSVTINMDIYHDEAIELTENFTVTLTNPTGSGGVTLKPGYDVATVNIMEQTTAPLCYEDSFNATALDDTWRTLKSSGSFSPQIVNNRLRLTPAEGNMATAVTKDYEFASSENIIIVEFTHYAYGGSGADGFALVLYDTLVGANPIPGAFGGSLGYAQKSNPGSDCTTAGGCPGFQGGWLGLGLDEYGNYQNPTEGRIGGTEFTPNAVSIRGDGSGQTGYEYLAGTSSLSPVLWKNQADPFPGDKFKMTVDARDSAHLYIRLERDTRSGYTTVINQFDAKLPAYNQSTTPDFVRLALTASTGGSNAIHEIDDITVWGRCTPYNPSTDNPPVVGFDAREPSIPMNDNNRSITTKISDKPFQLNVVSLSGDGSLAPYAGVNNNRVYLFAEENATCSLPAADQLAAISSKPRDWYATFVQGDTNQITLNHSVVGASKDKRIMMNFINWSQIFTNANFNCSNSNTQAVLKGVPQCLNSNQKLRDVFGTLADTCLNGSKPACESNSYTGSGLPSAPYDNEFGCYQCLAAGAGTTTCSSDNFAIRPANYVATTTPSGTLKAGNNFTLTTVAKGMGNTAITGYNGTAAISPTTQITSCPVRDGNLTDTSNAHFTSILFNGVDTNATGNIKYGDIGEFDMNITDSSWTAVDAVKNECIIDSNTTTPDANGRVGCNINTTLHPKVTPEHFDLSTTFTNHNITGGFTYLAPTTFGTWADLNTTVTAKALNGTTTKNYTSSCYAKDINTSFTYTKTSIPQSLTNLRFQETNSSSAIIAVPAGSSFSLNNIPKTVFYSDINGSAKLHYKINFDRNASVTIDPFRMSLSSMTATDTDSVTKTDNYVSYVDKNATFLYGRTHAPRYRYTENSGEAKIYYEVYCDASGDKTLLPGLHKGSSDSVGWYLNEDHNSSTDGNVTAIAEKNGATKVTNTSSLPLTSSNGISTTNLRYWYNGSNVTENIYPYKTTILVTPSSWLIYDPYNNAATTNDFEVEFYGSSNNWTGTRPKDSDGNEINQTTTDSDAATLTNKRILW